MKKWIAVFALFVTWNAHWLSNAPCQPPEISSNPYTGEKQYARLGEIYMDRDCFTEHVKAMSRTFATQKEVDDFKVGCSSGTDFSLTTTCTDWKTVVK